MGPAHEDDIRRRFGVFPNFFRLTAADPRLTAMLWGFVQFAYLDNPLPARFKDRLFIYLSRFCEVRYCVARHVGFLIGSQSPSGDYNPHPQAVEAVLPLLRRILPVDDGMVTPLATCEALPRFGNGPEADSPEEQALFACATHVFLQSADAARAHEALKCALGDSIEQLHLFLAFVRMAHYWTKLHPEIAFDDDLVRLLDTQQVLAKLILNDPASEWDGFSRRIARELAALHQLRSEHAEVAGALEELTADHHTITVRLRDAETHLRELIAALPAAVYACDSNGVITYFNEQAARLWGDSPDADNAPWRFLSARKFYSPDGQAVEAARLPAREAMETGVPILNRELVLVRADGTTVNLLINVTPLRNFGEAITGAVAVAQDMTELKRVQLEREVLLKELQRSNRELAAFSYSVAHDLQAPVRHVRALSQLLAQSAGDAQDKTKLADLIESAGAQMSRTIESLLHYAQAGQGRVNTQAVSLAQVVEDVRFTLQEPIRLSGARIVYDALPAVDADAGFIGQLVEN